MRSDTKLNQLCNLGVDSRLLMPKILEVLHEHISSFANVFFWIEEDGSIRDIYDEYPEAYAALPVYHERFLGRSELEVWCGLVESAQTRQAVRIDHFFRQSRSDVEKHEFFKQFLNKVGTFWALQKAVWVNGKPCGILQLKRREQDGDFSDTELRELERLGRYLELALRPAQKDHEEMLGHIAESAKLIATSSGEILNFTERAERIMMLSQGEEQIAAHFSFSHSQLPAPLIKKLERFAGNKNKAVANHITQNRWGKFQVSISRLNSDFKNEGRNLFLLQIDHFLPLSLFAFSKLEHMGLTNREFEVCFSILRGDSYAEIAEHHGLKPSTIVSHKKEIFRKAGVGERHQLMEKIFFNAAAD